MAGSLRRAAVAGTWYPSDPGALRAELDEYLARVPAPAAPGRLVGLVSPHAGLCYSGPVAAFAHALLGRARPRTVVLVGPSHYAAFDGVAVYAQGGFATPLGPLPVDAELAAAVLSAGEPLRADTRPHDEEHSLEMQLPFVRHLLPEARIVPMLMGSQARREVEALARALVAACAGRDDVVLVASSDLSHYRTAPQAEALDARVIADVEAFDPEALLRRLESRPDHACGGGPVVTVMSTARALGAGRAETLRHATSGDVPPFDRTRVVGYLAAAFTAA
jgi:AmmeMemoRadiSam system protein B